MRETTGKLACAIVFAIAIPSPAVAQSTVELWGAFSGAVAPPSGTLVSSYSPPLVFGTALASTASQAIALDCSPAPGFQAGINWFPSRHAGVQVLIDRVTMDLSGANGPYSASIKYVSIQPPDYVPSTFETGYSTAWPDTTGSLTHLTIGFNGIARTAGAGPVTASVSGGLTWSRIGGSARTLGYTEYHLGGHSTIFYEEMHLAYDLGPANRIGYNIGGDISVRVGRHAAFVAGYRFIDAGTVDLPVGITEVTNADQIAFSEPIETIAAAMKPTPARMTSASSRVVLGLKVMR